ncbi:MAG: sigma-54 dependent transcriptional regulator [bacterium]
MDKIFLIDDDKAMLELFRAYLERWNYLVVEIEKGADVTVERIRKEKPAVVLLDMILPDSAGLDILKELHPEFPELPIIMITSYGSIETAVEAMKFGAFDFLAKPADPTRLEILVKNAVKISQMAQKLSEYETMREPRSRYGDIIGGSDAMQQVYELIDMLAESDAPVLITGETGTGKELVAAAIHKKSSRSENMFVPVNCGALPEGIIESELFGHVRGAFTGAVRDKKGRFELADGGTILLDEAGELSPATQVKLLRALQEGSFNRVGGEDTTKVDVRVISATNKDLKSLMAQGKFREDLYYRLCVAPITLPPLRERRNDIPLLAKHFIKRMTEFSIRGDVSFSQECMDLLLDFDWPGNIRQLQNAIEFALLKCKGNTILPEHLPPEIENDCEIEPETKHGRKPVLDLVSVENALKETGGNKAKAARLLRVGRATLYRFLSDNNI